jgi:predicted amidohydrolase
MNTRARIATICQGQRFFRTVEENREHVLRLLDLALRQSPDLVCLPEAFTTVSVPSDGTGERAEPVPGPTVDAVAERARRHRCYVICSILTRREGRCWNSAVVIDRSGEVVDIYDKLHPVTTSPDYTVFERGMTPGTAAPVFDLDFGRVGIQICFDVGFPESWAELARQGARLVFWPSAYNGGRPLEVYAALHRCYVVTSVRTDRSRIIDPCGTVLDQTDRQVNVIVRDINLDFAVCHYDFNYSIPDRIQAAYPGRVAIRSHPDDGLFLVEPTDPALTVENLQAEFGFEAAEQYFQRHREAYAAICRGEGTYPQQAAHGDRPMYAKEKA